MMIRLTRTTAELLGGESAAEWQALEKLVRLGQWSSGPWADEGRLRQLAFELGVTLRVEGIAVLRPRPRARTQGRGSAWKRAIQGLAFQGLA